MSHSIWLFTSSLVWNYEGKSVDVIVECWGAGAHGHKDGSGGSGGAYAANTFTLKPGKYEIVVGDGEIGDGGETYLESEDGIVVKAAGGKMNGSVAHQLTESYGKIVYIGGKGGTASSANGAGGGGAAGALGNGFDGEHGSTATHKNPAGGGKYNNEGANNYGGNGAFYYAGPGTNGLHSATAGAIPGCGGGGGYNQATANLSAPGGVGCLVIWFPN